MFFVSRNSCHDQFVPLPVHGSMSFMDYFGENPASILIPLSKLHLSRLSWNWRKRSSLKITERTYEEGTEAFHTRRKSSHLEAASCGQSTRRGDVVRIRPAANN